MIDGGFYGIKDQKRTEVKIPETYTLEQSASIPEIDSIALALRHKRVEREFCF